MKEKNVKTFCGKPIVYYTLNIYERFFNKYKDTPYEINLAVNTDSPILIDQINKKGIKYILTDRKEDLAGDTVAKVCVIKDTLLQAEQKNNCNFDLIIDLDITSPLRELSDIEGAMNKVIHNAKCNFSYSVVEARRNPYFNMVCEMQNGFYDRVILSNYTARQQVPKCFDMNASIYVYKREYLINPSNENRFALIWEMNDNAVLDIDSEKDFEIMELLANYFWNKGKYLDIT